MLFLFFVLFFSFSFLFVILCYVQFLSVISCSHFYLFSLHSLWRCLWFQEQRLAFHFSCFLSVSFPPPTPFTLYSSISNVASNLFLCFSLPFLFIFITMLFLHLHFLTFLHLGLLPSLFSPSLFRFPCLSLTPFLPPPFSASFHISRDEDLITMQNSPSLPRYLLYPLHPSITRRIPPLFHVHPSSFILRSPSLYSL